MRAFDGGVAVGIPRHRYLPDHSAGMGAVGDLAGGVPRIDQFLVGLDRDEVVGELDEPVDGLLPADRHRDAGRDVGHVPETGGVHLEVIAAPVDQFAAEQLADDLDGFAQHVLAAFDGGPALADDVLVEVLAAAQAEGEPPVGQDLHRGGLLGDDGRVIPHRRAGHVGVEIHPFGGVRHRAQHRPRVGRVALRRQPGEKWSLQTSKSKPCSSAEIASRTRSLGPLCSVIRV